MNQASRPVTRSSPVKGKHMKATARGDPSRSSPSRTSDSIPPGSPADSLVLPERPTSAISPEKLADLFEEFSRTTQSLQESHQVLQQRVVSLRNELAEKNLQLERKKRLEGLGLMVAGVAHEIRNPLGSISLYLDSLTQEIRGDFSPSRGLDLIERMDGVVAHLNGVVENMLVFTSSVEVKTQPCDLAGLLAEALHLMQGEVERSVTAIVHAGGHESVPGAPASEELVVPGDPDRIRCVFINLIKNAIQAMEPGGEIRITWGRSERDGDRFVRCLLEDTGPGIPEESLEKVLVPFFSEGKGAGGVGLGLTIVHSIVERQGGRVTLSRASSGGLAVELEFRQGPVEGAQK